VDNIEKSNEYSEQVLELVPDTLVGLGVEHTPLAAATIPLFARLTGITDRLAVAESATAEILSSQSLPEISIIVAKGVLALVAVQRSDAVSAIEQYSFLKSERGTLLIGFVFADRVLGLLAQTMGNLDDS